VTFDVWSCTKFQISHWGAYSASPDPQLVGGGLAAPSPRTLPPPWPFILLPVTYTPHMLIPGWNPELLEHSDVYSHFSTHVIWCHFFPLPRFPLPRFTCPQNWGTEDAEEPGEGVSPSQWGKGLGKGHALAQNIFKFFSGIDASCCILGFVRVFSC